jgi:NAD(P)-dependent dehydrogenase (short-subunit alcohol dehydrogenase family)
LTSSGHFDQINGVNYRGCWLCSRAEIEQMLKQDPLTTHDGRPGNRGSVVNISSQLGVVGREKSCQYKPLLELSINDSHTMLCFTFFYTTSSSFRMHELMILLIAVYCAAKAAVIGMTRADAIDYSPSQIRVNCVCPGLIDTPMLGTFEQKVLERDIAVAPMNRMGTPQEVADVVLFFDQL